MSALLLGTLLVVGSGACISARGRSLDEQGAVEALLSATSGPSRVPLKSRIPSVRVLTVVGVVAAAAISALYRPMLLPIVGGAGALAASGIKVLKRRSASANLRAVEFYLPVVIERLVMAVEAGLDVLPAINAIVELEAQQGGSPDPVTKLFGRVRDRVEKGETLEFALEGCAASVESVSARHAMVHLAIAHREGGELMIPLRELSDATQITYQEQVEEDIAKLPVRATMPLLCTFAGLLLIFLTLPMIQIVTIAARSATH